MDRPAHHSAAKDLSHRLLQWAVKDRVGMDVGGGEPTGVFTRHGLAWAARGIGHPVRPDIHGIDVYEIEPDLHFVSAQANAVVTKELSAFKRDMLEQPKPVTQRQEIAAELFSVSYLDDSPRSRFLTLMTALESLLSPARRQAKAQDLVDLLISTVLSSELDKKTKTSMTGSLMWLRDESIGQTGRKLASQLLSGKRYSDMPPAAFFSDIYDIRSGIVHHGRVPKNIQDIANTTADFVADLITASINTPIPLSPSEADIAVAAYLRWLARMAMARETAVDDWLAAERELML